MWTQRDGVDFVVLLVADPLVDQVLRKDAAAEQELVIGFQCSQNLRQTAWGALDL